MADDSSEIVKEQSEAVAAADMMVKGNGPAFLLNLAYANAVAQQQNLNAHVNRMNAIAEASVGKVIESLITTQPSEGGVDVAILQQLMKGAQTTPPNTSG